MIDILLKLKILHDMLSSACADWKSSIWNNGLDDRHCCDGYMCGCGGTTIRQMYCHKLQIEGEKQ